METNLKETLYTGLENGMDYILAKGWTFDTLSKGLIFTLALTLTVTTLSVGVDKEEVSSNRNVVYAEEMSKEVNVHKAEPADTGVKVEKEESKKEVVKETSTDKSEFKLDKLWETGYTEVEKEFLHTVAPVAMEVAKEYKVYPSIIVAQAILESDWGQSELAVNAHNYFGVKGAYNGNTYQKPTMEDDGTGVQTEIIANFAKYPTIKESIESNARLIREGTGFDASYYKGAWVENTTSHKDATLALTGTYATDIYYNEKVNDIIEKNQLNVLDAELYN